MIPLKDYNPTRSTAVVTLVLIGACLFMYFGVQQSAGTKLVQRGAEDAGCAEFDFNLERAAIPYELTNGRPLNEDEAEFVKRELAQCPVSETDQDSFPRKSVWLALFTSMFLHGGLLHLGGNMLYLWIFGNNIEDRKGKVTYLVFYLLSGVVATAAHVVTQPDSPVPLVGASGAVAGVMGAYLVLYPKAPIKTVFTFILIWIRDIKAMWLLGFWFVSQFFIDPNSGVASMAHVGGFVFGVLAGLVWRATGPPARPVEPMYPATPYGY